jgi:(4-(4-[2-(gamma-L-glutamylamino)ethyl]phenoxymethyl)furan-2-yl)methanamine synthase
MTWLGLDIGGANLKAASAVGWSCSVPFALWRDSRGLADALAAIVEKAPLSDGLVVTMTGELCDCFRTKAEGVRHILAAAETVAGARSVRVYLVDGRFVTIDEARKAPQLAAASNWRALAQFACQFPPNGDGLLIDIGSTTTDIIPMVAGRVAARGSSDTERLATKELVYAGVGRTPVCAVVRELPWRGCKCPVAAEIFATTADAYVVLGDVPEDPHASWTADGRPLTIDCARQRLARQLCADTSELDIEDFACIAGTVRDAQLELLRIAIATVVQEVRLEPGVVVASGSGEFLVRSSTASALAGWQLISLADRLGPMVSRCATAFALSVLAEKAFEK